MTNPQIKDKTKKMKNTQVINKNSQRGFARWKGVSKEERSKEMSRVAKKLWEKIRAGDLTTQA